jgi:Family of unknown function (DUF6159)
MGRLQRSWSILKSSFSILGNNRTLLFFPIINFIIVLFICALFLVPAGYFFFSTSHDGSSSIEIKNIASSEQVVNADRMQYDTEADSDMKAIHWVIWGSLYIFSVFVATYLNVAFYTEILNALRGGAVDIANGFKTANSKIIQIFFWACLAGSVGIIIKMIEERLDILGKIIMRIIGITWSIAALFVIPVIVTEEVANRNPFTYLKKSSSIIIKTWGESLVGYIGFGMLNGVVFFCSFIAVLGLDIFALMVIKGEVGTTIAITCSVAWIISIIAFMYIVGVAEKIYRGALYLYASEGLIPEQYSQEVLETAWKTKKR